LRAFIDTPSHAVQLIAPTGFGKSTVAVTLARALLNLNDKQLESYPYFRRFTPDKGNIGIETVRDITTFLKLRTTGQGKIRRVIVIESADSMTIEAQNAILKLLEEPPADTVIIMTVSVETHMLSTITSRSQRILLHSPDRQATVTFFVQHGYSEERVATAYLMSGGLVGLMHAILTSDTEHPLVQAIDQAKTILKSDTFERLAMVDEIAKEKQVDQLLFALKQTSQAALTHAASQSGRDAAVRRWHSVLRYVHRAEKLHASSAQPKLLLTDLFLNL